LHLIVSPSAAGCVDRRREAFRKCGKMQMKLQETRSARVNHRPVKSLIKALRILDTLGESPNGLGITELSDALKAPKSTVHRLIATLEAGGYAVFDLPRSKYVLGTRVAQLGERLNHQSSLLTFGVPALEQLTRESGQASHLAILEGTEVVYISREESKEPIRISFGMGHRAPAHCTALGKAFLAALSDSDIRTLYRNVKLQALTPRTTTKLPELLAEMSAIRREGIAYDNEEYMPGLRCIAAPIRDFSSRTIAAMSLSFFKHKLTPERKSFFKQALLHASADVSEKLGYSSGSKKITT
jgi:IclR family transcriptional regulator, KDG regulon repressor